MSFNVVLQYNSSPANQVTKSLTTKHTCTGTLRDGSSALDPVVLVEISDFPSQCNYASIAAFDRQYFIKDIKSVRNGLWEIHMHVDVLGTYDSAIRGQQAIIGKQANSYNLYLNDGNYKCYQNPHIITKNFPSGFNTSNFSYVLAMCCDKTQTAP